MSAPGVAPDRRTFRAAAGVAIPARGIAVRGGQAGEVYKKTHFGLPSVGVAKTDNHFAHTSAGVTKPDSHFATPGAGVSKTDSHFRLLGAGVAKTDTRHAFLRAGEPGADAGFRSGTVAVPRTLFATR